MGEVMKFPILVQWEQYEDSGNGMCWMGRHRDVTSQRDLDDLIGELSEVRFNHQKWHENWNSHSAKTWGNWPHPAGSISNLLFAHVVPIPAGDRQEIDDALDAKGIEISEAHNIQKQKDAKVNTEWERTEYERLLQKFGVTE
jgi:hypothetical protein